MQNEYHDLQCFKWIREKKIRDRLKNESKLYLIINNDSFGVCFLFQNTVEFFMIRLHIKILKFSNRPLLIGLNLDIILMSL